MIRKPVRVIMIAATIPVIMVMVVAMGEHLDQNVERPGLENVGQICSGLTASKTTAGSQARFPGFEYKFSEDDVSHAYRCLIMK